MVQRFCKHFPSPDTSQCLQHSGFRWQITYLNLLALVTYHLGGLQTTLKLNASRVDKIRPQTHITQLFQRCLCSCWLLKEAYRLPRNAPYTPFWIIALNETCLPLEPVKFYLFLLKKQVISFGRITGWGFFSPCWKDVLQQHVLNQERPEQNNRGKKVHQHCFQVFIQTTDELLVVVFNPNSDSACSIRNLVATLPQTDN